MPEVCMNQPPSSSVGPSPKRPSLAKRLTLAAFMLVLGMALGPGVLFFVVFTQLPSGKDAPVFETPGTTIFHAEEPGSVTIWHQTRGVINGKVHTQGHTLPNGLQVVVTQQGSSDPLPIQPASQASVTMGAIERRSAFEFEAKTPGDYVVTASGGEAPAVLAVSPSLGSRFVSLILGTVCSGLAGFLLIIGAIAVVVVTIVQYSKSAPHAHPQQTRPMT